MRKRDFLHLIAGTGIALGLAVSLIRPLAAAVVSDETGISLPVLMYHHVTADSSYWGRDSISPTELEEDLKYLCDMGYHTVLLSQVADYVDGFAALPPNPVALTFDDGFLNYRDVVLPLLRKYRCCATLAVTGAFADAAENRTTDDPDFEYLTWEELAPLDPAVTEIAYHSYDSHYVRAPSTGRSGMKKKAGESDADYRTYLTDEYTRFRRKTDPLGIRVTAVAYPYGSYSADTDAVLCDLGLRVTLTCESGVNRIVRGDKTCLRGLKRNNRPHGVSSASFLARTLNPVRAPIQQTDYSAFRKKLFDNATCRMV